QPNTPPATPPTASYADANSTGQQASGTTGQWYPAQPTTAAPVEPPEGWQAGYLKQKKLARWFMISTIALAATTLLAGMMSLGLGVALASSDNSGGGGSHSRMFDDDGPGFGDDDGYGMGNGNGQSNPRSRQLPDTTATPTPTPSATTPASPSASPAVS
ncbi:MAG: hypothetical protein QG597_745, partial [Actinomycetota bacterium]|nr:hypothetical protein [Actinomycetota bacterium]